MALPTRLRHLLVILVAAVAIPASTAEELTATGPDMTYNCVRDPRWLSTANGTAFRTGLAPLLAALPSAAAPTGFASLRSADDRAFARGLCFGESPTPKDCRKCLSEFTHTESCHSSRRAGFWNAGCFLAYTDSDSDTNASSVHEDEWFSRIFVPDDGSYYPQFYDVSQIDSLVQSLAPRAANGSSDSPGGRMVATANATAQANSTVRALAQCTPGVTASECVRCLEKSAQGWSDFLRVAGQGHEYDRAQSAGVLSAFRYKCVLRVEISRPMMLPLAKGKGTRLREMLWDNLAIMVVVALAIVSW